MTRKDSYDKCMLDNEGYLIIFDGHYNLQESREIINKENYDDSMLWSEIEHIYIKFGFVNFEGERSNGWMEFNDYKKGRIKATRLKNDY